MRRPLLALIVLVVLVLAGYLARAAQDDHHSEHQPGAHRTSATTGAQADGLRQVALSSLPPQAATTVRLIRAGGPFPYPRNDGVVFHNDEHRLPREPDGYYREYTVPTPGADTRGARRLITGRDGQFYYTGDHYDSFVRVDLAR